MAAIAFLALAALLVGAAAAEHAGCPACGTALNGRKISTVHPGEPAAIHFGVASAEACVRACLQSSADVHFYTFVQDKTQQGESTCKCTATCYSSEEAGPTEGAVSGSLCRDQECPKVCSNAPSPNVIYLGKPARVVAPTFLFLSANGTSSNSTGNFTMFANSTTFWSMGNSTGNATVASSGLGMSFEDCRALAASSVFPATPFFTHLEAMGTCMMYESCIGIAPAGTSTAKSGSFCVSMLLESKAEDNANKDAQI